MPDDPGDMSQIKQRMRATAFADRDNQSDKDLASRRICETLAALPEYAAAKTVLYYVHARSEVRTQEFLAAALKQDKRIVVPYCVGDRLELFLMKDFDELQTGCFGILEPSESWRNDQRRRARPVELDLIAVPGVAFDRQGGRLGHGRAYYDRLLAEVRPETVLVALAFECQLVPQVPMDEHDVFMDKIITEKSVYSRTRNA